MVTIIWFPEISI